MRLSKGAQLEAAAQRIVGSDGRVEHRAIEPGPEQSGERVILQGLAEDELVVVGRVHAAVPGRIVDIERKSFTPQPTPAAAPRVTPPATPQPETADESTRLP